jgi:hypothetical protein
MKERTPKKSRRSHKLRVLARGDRSLQHYLAVPYTRAAEHYEKKTQQGIKGIKKD